MVSARTRGPGRSRQRGAMREPWVGVRSPGLQSHADTSFAGTLGGRGIARSSFAQGQGGYVGLNEL